MDAGGLGCGARCRGCNSTPIQDLDGQRSGQRFRYHQNVDVAGSLVPAVVGHHQAQTRRSKVARPGRQPQFEAVRHVNQCPWGELWDRDGTRQHPDRRIGARQDHANALHRLAPRIVDAHRQPNFLARRQAQLILRSKWQQHWNLASRAGTHETDLAPRAIHLQADFPGLR